MTTELKRILGVRDLTLLTIGAVIGSGIYIVPAFVLKATGGSLLLSMLVWFLAGVMSVLGALTYGELSASNPEAGGFYVYIRDAFGRMPAFLSGWTLFFVIGPGAVATLSVAFASYLGELTSFGPVTAKLIAVAMIIVTTAINVRGTRHSANVQNWSTALKATCLFALGAYLVLAGGKLGEASAAVPVVWTASVWSGLLTAMIGVLWTYEGWQFSSFSAGETIDPQRTFPRGIVLGTATLVVLYCLANAGYIAALGPARAMASERIAADAISAKLGATAGKLIVIPILVSIFSAAHAVVLTSPRVFYAMARDRVFFRSLGDVHPRFGTPSISIVWMGIIAIVMAITGTFEQLLTYVVFTGWIFYALGAASIFLYRRREPNATRPYRVPGYPWPPLLFVLAAAVIVLNAVWAQPVRAAIGLLIVFTGAPAYLIWRRGSV